MIPTGYVRCALCAMEVQGFAVVTDDNGNLVRVCHSQTRSCYQQWTVYGKRPT